MAQSDKDKPVGLADRAVTAVTGAMKRFLFHGSALVISGVMATDAAIGSFSYSLAYFLCNYVGILYLFPAETSIIPTALGLILGLVWLGLGYPFFMLPFWAGVYCFAQRGLNCGNIGKINLFSTGWLILCGFVSFYFSALVPTLWPIAIFLPAGFVLNNLWKKHQKRKEEEMNIKSGKHTFGDEAPSGQRNERRGGSGWDWDQQPPDQNGNRGAAGWDPQPPGQGRAQSGDPRYDMGWNSPTDNAQTAPSSGGDPRYDMGWNSPTPGGSGAPQPDRGSPYDTNWGKQQPASPDAGQYSQPPYAGQPSPPPYGQSPQSPQGQSSPPPYGQPSPPSYEQTPPPDQEKRTVPGRFSRNDAGWGDFPPEPAVQPAHWREFNAQAEQLAAKAATMDPELRELIEHIGRHTRNILQCMAEDQRDVAPGERFLSRYLPAAINVVESCARIPSDMPEADSITKSTRDVLQRLEAAFKAMHANLIENDKIDARADLAVLDKLLKMQGH